MFTRSHGSVPVNYVPPKKEPKFTTTDGGGGGDRGDAGDDIGIDTNDNYDYGSPEEELKSECIDIYYHPVKEEPEAALAVIVNGSGNCHPPEEKPELVATGDDTDDDGGPDVGYDCCHCGITLRTHEFKVKHELRCKVLKKQKELESQVTKLYHCGYCRCPFVNEEYKEQHQRKWCRKRPVAKRKDANGPYFGCDKCEFVTKHKDNLERHFWTHNKNNAEWFTCTQCSYKTVRKFSMTRHMEIHNNTFSCCCPICGKSFRRKPHLDDHLLKQHSDESDEVAKLITSKVHTCNICDYRTIVKTAFKKHLALTHLKGVGSQKYECLRCPYSTFRKSHLKRHSEKHAEQKDYRCAVCKKQFARKTHLDSHILYIHADNVDLVKMITSKIFPCESCSFKSVDKTNLKRHVQSKHIEFVKFKSIF